MKTQKGDTSFPEKKLLVPLNSSYAPQTVSTWWQKENPLLTIKPQVLNHYTAVSTVVTTASSLASIHNTRWFRLDCSDYVYL